MRSLQDNIATRVPEDINATSAVPVIVRVDENEILLDLRTVAEDEFGFIIEGLREIAANQ